jgi:hypothetical protein
MKKIILLTLLPFLFSFTQITAAVKDSTIITQPKEIKQPEINKWYYGGTVGFNFWSDYFYLSVNPLVGYNVSQQFSVGGKIQYAYINDKRNNYADVTSHNYGASIFSRYRPIQPIYLHAEFEYGSYEEHTIYYYPLTQKTKIESKRNWVPFLYLGGGYVQQLSPNASVYVEVLFDVIQDKNSPYENWDPIISVGGGIGF